MCGCHSGEEIMGHDTPRWQPTSVKSSSLSSMGLNFIDTPVCKISCCRILWQTEVYKQDDRGAVVRSPSSGNLLVRTTEMARHLQWTVHSHPRANQGIRPWALFAPILRILLATTDSSHPRHSRCARRPSSSRKGLLITTLSPTLSSYSPK